MRVLITVPPIPDRLHHLVPLAWALRTAGHEVRVAGAPKFAETINLTGLVAVADDPVEHAELWRPDLVVWDEGAPVGAAVAGAAGATSVRVVGLLTPCAPGEADLTLDTRPPSLSEPGHLPMRYVPYAGPVVVPMWLRRNPRRQRVLVTGGAVGLLGGIGEIAAEVVCAAAEVPPDVDLPATVRLVEDLPLTAVVPTCAAVVHDGAALPVAAALAAGLPQTGMPTDLFLRVVDQGAGVLVGPEWLTRVLTDPTPRLHAERLRAELAAMPSPHALVPTLANAAHLTRT